MPAASISSHGTDVLVTGSRVTFNGADIVTTLSSLQREYTAAAALVATLLEEEGEAMSEISALMATVRCLFIQSRHTHCHSQIDMLAQESAELLMSVQKFATSSSVCLG